MCGYETNHSKKILCGNDCYNTNHSKIPRTLQKVIFAEMTFIGRITRNCSGNDFYKTNDSKIRIFFTPYSRKFQFMSKLVKVKFSFVLTFIRPINSKFRGGNDFYKINNSKISGIKLITPKSNWSNPSCNKNYKFLVFVRKCSGHDAAKDLLVEAGQASAAQSNGLARPVRHPQVTRPTPPSLPSHFSHSCT